jgi:hypothetical protein
VRNVTCYESGCAVIGSLGNGNGGADTVDNVLFSDFRCNHSSNAAWIKTYPGQGGHVRNVTFRNFEISDVNQPIYITPCTYSGQNCDSSRLPIEDITWSNIRGHQPLQRRRGHALLRRRAVQEPQVRGHRHPPQGRRDREGAVLEHPEPGEHGAAVYRELSRQLAAAAEWEPLRRSCSFLCT